jgi:hypothetical protein
MINSPMELLVAPDKSRYRTCAVLQLQMSDNRVNRDLVGPDRDFYEIAFRNSAISFREFGASPK